MDISITGDELTGSTIYEDDVTCSDESGVPLAEEGGPSGGVFTQVGVVHGSVGTCEKGQDFTVISARLQDPDTFRFVTEKRREWRNY